MKRSANIVSAQANPRERVKPRSGGRSQNCIREKLGVVARAGAASMEQ